MPRVSYRYTFSKFIWIVSFSTIQYNSNLALGYFIFSTEVKCILYMLCQCMQTYEKIYLGKQMGKQMWAHTGSDGWPKCEVKRATYPGKHADFNAEYACFQRGKHAYPRWRNPHEIHTELNYMTLLSMHVFVTFFWNAENAQISCTKNTLCEQPLTVWECIFSSLQRAGRDESSVCITMNR